MAMRLLASGLSAVYVLGALIVSPPARAELSNPFLWELSKNGKALALFGSLHVGKNDFYPVPEFVIKRFEAAKVLAVETDMTLPASQQVCGKLAATTERIDSVLSQEDFAALTGYLRASNLPPNAVEGRKLWFVNLIVVGTELQQLGVDFSRGLDVIFVREAKQAKKRVVEVVGAGKQCESLAAAPNAEAAAAMTRFLETVRSNKMEKRLFEMIDAYRVGDGATLSRVIGEEFGDTALGQAARRRVFEDRHAAMAEVIESYLKQPDSHFVVISIGHLVGDNNLLDALAKRGITVKRADAPTK
ncbi:MAG: TraB/GumN family protein [Burkholderiales bacterium]|nr:TraB/GumN family protein [Burkholderiales bacterium]